MIWYCKYMYIQMYTLSVYIAYIRTEYDRVARHISSEMPLVHCTCTRRNLNGPRSTSFWDVTCAPGTLDHLLGGSIWSVMSFTMLTVRNQVCRNTMWLVMMWCGPMFGNKEVAPDDWHLSLIYGLNVMQPMMFKPLQVVAWRYIYSSQLYPLDECWGKNTWGEKMYGNVARPCRCCCCVVVMVTSRFKWPNWRTRLHEKPRRAAVQRMLAGQHGRLLCHTLSGILFTTSDESDWHIKIPKKMSVEHFENLTSRQSTIEMHCAIVQFWDVFFRHHSIKSPKGEHVLNSP